MARHFCRVFTRLRFSRQILIKARNIKRHVSPSSWSGADTCGRTGGRTDKRKLIGAFRDYVTVFEKVNLSLFLNITPVGNEAASIYNLSTKWRQEIIFARSLQVCTGPRGSRHTVFHPYRGYSLGRHPKCLLKKTCNYSKTSKSLLVYEDGKCEKSSRICKIWGSQRNHGEGTSLAGYDAVSIGKELPNFWSSLFSSSSVPSQAKKKVLFTDWKAVLFQKTGILSQVVCKFLSEEDAGLGGRSVLKYVCQVINSRLLLQSPCALKTMCVEENFLILSK